MGGVALDGVFLCDAVERLHYVAMRYRMIALDLDGTLLDDDGQISPANRDAIAAAQRAGMMVVPCTGRSWRESRMILDDLPGLQLGVFVTGAAVVDIATGRSLDMAAIEPHLACELVHFLQDEPEAVLVYRDAALAGHDYLVTGHGELTDNTQWWFTITGCSTCEQRQVTADDLHHALRVGMVATGKRMAELEPPVQRAFADRVLVHSFQAINQPDEDGIHVLEIFAAGVDKWRGLRWIAQQHDIIDKQIVAIGDQINDLAMLQNAGCGIAMGNAADCARQQARHLTRDNRNDGVAYAIEQVLLGKW